MINIQKNIPLAPLTTFKIGGPARYLVEVKNAEELAEAFAFARENSSKTVVLGGGSNILVSDNGFDGLVIMMKNETLEVDGESINVGAGTSLSELVRFAAENGLTGLEWAVGIPGTVGGAVRGNAGAYGGSISDSVSSVEVFAPEKFLISNSEFLNKSQSPITDYELQNCEFSYRTSIFKKSPKFVILSADLRLQKGDREQIKEKMQNIVKERAGKVVKGASVGSFFMNPVVTDKQLRREFAMDTGTELKGGTLPAGWLIEHVGLRGKKIGGAMVSEKHGNFIINTGNATAEDIVMLASIIKQKVRNQYNVQLKEEVVLIGF